MTSTGQADGYGHGADDGGRRRGRVPIVLIVAGAVATVLAVAVGVVGIVTTVRAVPTGILTISGQPGKDVLAVIDAPGSAQVHLEADTRYTVLVVGDDGAPRARLEDDVAVTDPAGTVSTHRPGATQNFSLTNGNRTAYASADFLTTRAGTHTVDIPAADRPGAEVFVAELATPGTLVFGIFGGVLGIIIAVFLGIAGIGMLIAGLVWRVLRKPSAPPRASVAPPLY